MKIAAIAGVLALTLGTVQAWAEAGNPLDARFAAMASIGNSFEVASSRLALRRSTNPQILRFARMMIADHMKAQSKLDAAAATSGGEAGLLLDADHQTMVDQLSALTGPEFDQAYATDQVAAHQESQQTLSAYVDGGGDPALQEYASVTLPVVNLHLRRIMAMSAM